MTDTRQLHWQEVYTTKADREVSWYQDRPEPSLSLIKQTGITPSSCIIDIGGGASRLVDALVEEGYRKITVLDLSGEALARASSRIGAAGQDVIWISADATAWEPTQSYDVWYDRAAFHFLTSSEQQQAYLVRLQRGLKIGGYVIFGTFALDGPEKCSGLPVTRHSAESLSELLGRAYQLIDTRRHDHATPWDSVQKFQFSTFKRTA